MIKEGNCTYTYGYLDKVISVFTGKPAVAGLGHAFLMRNYRAGLGKWQTADPMGYPDGWNQLAYCGNGVMSRIDVGGGKGVMGVLKIKTVDDRDDPILASVKIDYDDSNPGLWIVDGAEQVWKVNVIK